MLSQAQDQDLHGRVTWQQHDFFDPQPIHDASAFLLRQCIHNYNDEEAIKLVRAVVPALERCARGTPLLINDLILPDSDIISRSTEHHLRQIDFCMMMLVGAKERSEADFAQLVKQADRRLEIVKVYKGGIGLGLFVVQLNT